MCLTINPLFLVGSFFWQHRGAAHADWLPINRGLLQRLGCLVEVLGYFFFVAAILKTIRPLPYSYSVGSPLLVLLVGSFSKDRTLKSKYLQDGTLPAISS